MHTLNIEKNDRILIVAPHPDDECIGCGGLLCKYKSQCTVWALTDGRYGGIYDDEVANAIQRKYEFEQEMRFLEETDYRMFGLEDGKLIENIDLISENDISVYTKIFVPNQLDNHPDHRAAYQMVERTVKKSGVPQNIYQYEVSTPLNICTDYIDISDVIWNKLQLISFHKSQMREFDYCEMARSLNKYRGILKRIRAGYIECYYMQESKN